MEDRENVRAALEQVGVEISDIWDLVNSRATPKPAVDTLIGLLTEIEDPKIKEGIVRALADRKARGIAVRPLLEAMGESHGNRSLCWAIGNTLSVLVQPSDEVFEELEALIVDSDLGAGRQMLTDALVKVRHPRAVEVLLSILNQEEMTGHAINALGRLRALDARTPIAAHLESPNRWVRKEAKKAIARIDESKQS